MKKTLISSAVAAVGLALALASAPAAAAITWYSPITAFEDDNLDHFIDNNSNGLLDVGDRLVSVLEFNSSLGILAGQGPTPIGPGFELTGVSDITITSKVETAAGSGIYNFTFGATTDGYLTGGTGSVTDIGGAMVVMWYDSSPDLNVINGACGSLAACLTAASDGIPDPWLALGLLGDADAFWTATGSDNIAGMAGTPSTTKVATVNFNLNMLENNTGMDFGLQDCSLVHPNCGDGDGKILLIGSADILGGQGLVDGWHARSDTDAQVVPIPEPGALSLAALGLFGIGVFARRRKMRQ